MANARKRPRNQFTRDERNHLLSIMTEYAPLLADKNISILNRKEIWNVVETSFNNGEGLSKRTSAQLKKYWQNYRYHKRQSKTIGKDNLRSVSSATKRVIRMAVNIVPEECSWHSKMADQVTTKYFSEASRNEASSQWKAIDSRNFENAVKANEVIPMLSTPQTTSALLSNAMSASSPLKDAKFGIDEHNVIAPNTDISVLNYVTVSVLRPEKASRNQTICLERKLSSNTRTECLKSTSNAYVQVESSVSKQQTKLRQVLYRMAEYREENKVHALGEMQGRAMVNKQPQMSVSVPEASTSIVIDDLQCSSSGREGLSKIDNDLEPRERKPLESLRELSNSVIPWENSGPQLEYGNMTSSVSMEDRCTLDERPKENDVSSLKVARRSMTSIKVAKKQVLETQDNKKVEDPELRKLFMGFVVMKDSRRKWVLNDLEWMTSIDNAEEIDRQSVVAGGLQYLNLSHARPTNGVENLLPQGRKSFESFRDQSQSITFGENSAAQLVCGDVTDILLMKEKNTLDDRWKNNKGFSRKFAKSSMAGIDVFGEKVLTTKDNMRENKSELKSLIASEDSGRETALKKLRRTTSIGNVEEMEVTPDAIDELQCLNFSHVYPTKRVEHPENRERNYSTAVKAVEGSRERNQLIRAWANGGTLVVNNDVMSIVPIENEYTLDYRSKENYNSCRKVTKRSMTARNEVLAMKNNGREKNKELRRLLAEFMVLEDSKHEKVLKELEWMANINDTVEKETMKKNNSRKDTLSSLPNIGLHDGARSMTSLVQTVVPEKLRSPALDQQLHLHKIEMEERRLAINIAEIRIQETRMRIQSLQESSIRSKELHELRLIRMNAEKVFSDGNGKVYHPIVI